MWQNLKENLLSFSNSLKKLFLNDKLEWRIVISIIFWFSFSIKWHIDLHGLFDAKAILVEERRWYYLTHSLVGEKEVQYFSHEY